MPQTTVSTPDDDTNRFESLADMMGQHEEQQTSDVYPEEVCEDSVPVVDGVVVEEDLSTGSSEPATRTVRTGRVENLTPFPVGVSGNPSGRRKQDPAIVALLKSKSLSAANTLVELMENPKVSPKVRCQAAEVILDRVYGKAVQPIDASIGGNGDPVVIAFAGVLSDWAK